MDVIHAVTRPIPTWPRFAAASALALAVIASNCVADVPLIGDSVTANCTMFTAGINPVSSVQRITLGPDGNLWFTEYVGAIGRITPDGVVTEFTEGLTTNGGPLAITAGPDGNVWYAEAFANIVGRITPDGTITEFDLGGDSDFYIEAIVTGPDGNLWFTNSAGNAIGRISPQGDHIQSFSTGITPQAEPFGIVVGSDGNLWFTEYSIGGIGRITPDGTVTEFRNDILSNNEVQNIAAGLDGTLWFTYENSPGGIGVITMSGDVTFYNIGFNGFGASGIVIDSGNNIWFSGGAALGNSGRPLISQLDRSGHAQVDECVTNLSVNSKDLTVGPDGNIWFTNYNAIGRVNIRIFKNGFD